MKRIGAGLRSLGLKPKSVVAIVADTSPSWLLVCEAALLCGFTVCTVSTHGNARDAATCLEECDASVVFCDARGLRITEQHVARSATRLVLLPPSAGDFPDSPDAASSRAVTLEQLEINGEAFGDAVKRQPHPHDVAIIMFTSGTTGSPKGVLLTHEAVVAAIAGLTDWRDAWAPTLLGPGEVYLAYLPLFHVFEFLAQNAMLVFGAALAFAKPRSLAADAKAAGATIRATGPTILERIVAETRASAKKLVPPQVARLAPRSTSAVAACLAWAVEQTAAPPPPRRGVMGLLQRNAARASSLLTLPLFYGARRALGGKLKLVICGSAPLRPSTGALVRRALGCPIVTAYGLSETCGMGTLSAPDDGFDSVGRSLSCCMVKLVAWEEGGYSPAQSPPRGEVWIGGPTVAAGYLLRRSLTASSFVTDAQGVAWHATGDIGAFDQSRGTLRIIDRKKELVKLERGEYVSLGRASEACQGGLLVPLGQAMAVAKPGARSVTALVAPDMAALREELRRRGSPFADAADAAVVASEDAQAAVLEEVRASAGRAGVSSWEAPTSVRLVPPPAWSEANEMLTALGKVRRGAVSRAFAAEVAALEKEGGRAS